MRPSKTNQWSLSVVAAWLALASCGSPPPEVPAHPTWGDVEPILRKECTSCHGGTAPRTGSALGVTYRFDFFDLTAASCGDAATAVSGPDSPRRRRLRSHSTLRPTAPQFVPRCRPPGSLAGGLGVANAVALVPRPAEGNAAAREPPANPPGHILRANGQEPVHALGRLEDPDDDSVVGVLTIGDVTLRMDRPGPFSILIDGSQWPAGPRR